MNWDAMAHCFWSLMLIAGLCVFLGIVTGVKLKQDRKRARYQKEMDPWSL